MLPKNCGQLLFNAVRETLETMAFAEVVPCSIKVGDEEFSHSDDDFAVSVASVVDGIGDEWGEHPITEDTWGTAVPELPPENEDIWGSAVPEVPSISNSWGSSSPEVPASGDSWGDPEPLPALENDDSWGEVTVTTPDQDPWGEAAAMAQSSDSQLSSLKEADFNDMIAGEHEWCWACMKVNSPDIRSVWFIVTKGLANSLAQNMYAGEDFQLDNPLIRDLIAELTNVLGGRLMLLLEEMGGKFTLTVPDIGFGYPEAPDQGLDTAVCKVVVDGEFPVIAALCFNPGGISAIGRGQ